MYFGQRRRHRSSNAFGKLAIPVLGALALSIAGAHGAAAQGTGVPLRIGVVTDLSGVNLDYGGPTAVIAAKMAVEDSGGSVLGRPVEVLALDHQNKADVASQKVRQWFDQDNVEMVTELLNSSVALAVAKIASEKNKIAM